MYGWVHGRICRFFDGLRTGRKGGQWTWQRWHSMRQRCKILSRWPTRQRLEIDSPRVSWTRHQLPCRCLPPSACRILQSASFAANISTVDMLLFTHANCMLHNTLQRTDIVGTYNTVTFIESLHGYSCRAVFASITMIAMRYMPACVLTTCC